MSGLALGHSLTLVMAGFLTLLGIVMAMAFRERKRARTIPAGDAKAEASSDTRVLVIVFAAIPGGMLLTVLVAWLVFL